MQQITVLCPLAVDAYDYMAPDSLPVGTFVRVPLGRKHVLGVVWDSPINQQLDAQKLKPIDQVLPLPLLPQQTIQFVNWVAKYTLSKLGPVLKMALNPEIEKISKHPIVFDTPRPDFKQLDFSEQQKQAIKQLLSLRGFNVALLDGITGSGKTEVYFEAIATHLKQGEQVLVLLPEIILTTAWLERFKDRFGVYPALWHSSITAKTRRDTWEAVRSGASRVIVGARSALFLPFQNLGLIVIDEEHDASFKQEDGVLYNARDMAIVRAKQAPCPIILASATPSLETYCNAENGKYQHIHLTERFKGAVLPEIELVDMRNKEKGPVRFISARLAQLLQEKLNQHQQSLLFLNRRGYAPLVLCRACGEKLSCPHCSAWLTEHRKTHTLQCHHCGYTRKRPDICPTCHEQNSFISCGPGVERIAEEVQTLLPQAKTATITSDTLNSPKQFTNLLDQIQKGEIDILIGTQILAKGHHFPNLTLVGVIDADMGLAGGDLRAGERTFQLLQQVMGRAGRSENTGIAVLQTYSPENLILKALQNNDRNTFLTEEIAARKLLKMPPFGKLAAIIVSGKNESLTYKTAKNLALTAPSMPGLEVLGPVVAPLAKLKDKNRYRLLVKATKNITLQNILHPWVNRVKIPSSVNVRIDIDPYSFF
ncbi:MAG: primosomal protein N' [Alphaproteobacteria bacterium]|nr:primosomal protein N' [Alphaproteobacteria bacterium]